jgi:catechol 2,3-dioxygenase
LLGRQSEKGTAMSAQQTVAAQPQLSRLPEDRILYGAVHLDVVELESSLAFWRDLIGLTELPSGAGEARLGVNGRALLVLHPGATRPAGRGHAGLYHLAIHLPDEREFARILVRIARASVAQSPTDHIFSKATYLHDPDGIMLELTLETPERYGSIEIRSGMITMFDRDGRRRSPTEPLDVAEAIAPLYGGDTDLPLPDGTYIGHVHLHVRDLRASYDFYRDVIGFEEHAYMAAIGMADLGAGGSFPHRIAMNTWQGPLARQAPEGTAGLRRCELILPALAQLDELSIHADAAGVALSAADGAMISLHDPAGNEIRVSTAERVS